MLWSVYTSAKHWSVLPSDYLGIDDPFSAYCFNEAVTYFGRYVEEEVSKIDMKPGPARDMAIRKTVEAIITGKESKRFADPAMVVKKKG